MSVLKELQKQLVEFGEKRDWRQYHSPKNLAMALNVECGELLELFQWHTEEQSKQASKDERQAAGEELADILMYSLLLADALDIDIESATKAKLKLNESRFPPNSNEST
ncbi:nucleotide pyrophosphohydrolase [Agaribacterium sp. ZY112]|uniref:nucleotide pyrophosphohydrolase n=1 Tax=Agaribacterium sp. ZY112 TaxID=3233574 RepID=UPI003525F2AC